MKTLRRLPNGACVLAERNEGEKRVVMCKWGKNFVTWRVDAKDNAYWGHYFGRSADALEDFRKR